MSLLDKDPYLLSVIETILVEPLVKDKWFHFGYELGISVNDLSTFECHLQDYIQCTREVIIFWRKKNMSETWMPVAQALHFAGLHGLEEQIIQRFATEGKLLEFYFVCIDLISLLDSDKLKDHRLRPVPYGKSFEEILSNTPVKKGINDSVL